MRACTAAIASSSELFATTAISGTAPANSRILYARSKGFAGLIVDGPSTTAFAVRESSNRIRRFFSVTRTTSNPQPSNGTEIASRIDSAGSNMKMAGAAWSIFALASRAPNEAVSTLRRVVTARPLAFHQTSSGNTNTDSIGKGNLKDMDLVTTRVP